MTARNLDALFRPASVAVVGAAAVLSAGMRRPAEGRTGGGRARPDRLSLPAGPARRARVREGDPCWPSFA